MLTPSCDLLPPTSFSSLLIDSAYQQQHLLPLEPGMSDAEALTLADFDFPDEEAVQQAEDAWFVGRQVGEAKLAARKTRFIPGSEVVHVASTTRTSGEVFGAGCGYTAFRAANPDPEGQKKKGRPMGWRKGLHMRPKTKVSESTKATSPSPTSEPPETKAETERVDEIKVEPPPVPARDAPLTSDSNIQKPDQESSPRARASASTGYAAFRLANPGGKRLGRPIGWKMGVFGARKRIEKDRNRGKGGKKLVNSKDGSKILASIEMNEQKERMSLFIDQQNGEVSMQLDQKPALVESSLQLDSPAYESVDEKHEAMEVDKDPPLPASFWDGVLAAANASASPSVIKQEHYNKPDDENARRDSAFGSVYSRATSLVSVDHDSTDEVTQEDESGSSDLSHFSA